MKLPTPKQQVLKRYPNAGCQLSAMWGWQIIDYGEDGYGTVMLGRARRSESAAWAAAARNLKGKRHD